jgi:hypothetical protein
MSPGLRIGAFDFWAFWARLCGSIIGMLRKYRGFSLVFVLGLFLLSDGLARAGTILFSDLGTGVNVYDPLIGDVVSGATSTQGSAAFAFGFMPSSTAQLQQIDAAVTYFDEGPNSIELTLYTDNGGTLGSVLDQWNLTGLPDYVPGHGFCCALQTITPHSSVVLTSGVRYWLFASTISGDTADVWQQNSMGVSGPFVSAGGGATMLLGAFDVIGSAVPEPTTFSFVAAGLIMTWGGARRGFRRSRAPISEGNERHTGPIE